MASDKTASAAAEVGSKKERKDKDKKEKKEKRRSESEGVHKSKKDKKEKKHKKEKLAQALDEHLQASAAASVAGDVPIGKTEDESADDASDVEKPQIVAPTVIRGAMVEFALPLANEKHQKKIYKVVKKAAKNQALLRGVKEVNKALRKSPAKTPSTAHVVPGLVVIAGDISPAEVIMHLPLACEDVNAPYIFVTSRAELGAAAKTKRPTSVVMLRPEGKKAGKKAAAAAAAATGEKGDGDDDDDGADDYAEAYQELLKILQKEYTKQMKGLI